MLPTTKYSQMLALHFNAKLPLTRVGFYTFLLTTVTVYNCKTVQHKLVPVRPCYAWRQLLYARFRIFTWELLTFLLSCTWHIHAAWACQISLLGFLFSLFFVFVSSVAKQWYIAHAWNNYRKSRFCGSEAFVIIYWRFK